MIWWLELGALIAVWLYVFLTVLGVLGKVMR
jgi:hypothetical protein